ncbi:MAG TPA: cytochrome b N-terminal domain-containing protein [Pyrinomonadaceae bacterium]|jgi:ubiquinol-cytochrome c reductase cytochrome b subunit|nr:cytochrome b N-terminal domain-containing protein [Pyrinomonadaceae bacterium]
MAQEERQNGAQVLESRFTRRTNLALIANALFEDEPRSAVEAWARTMAGAVWVLLALQFLTGILLAFYYAPSTESAHTTVAYIEKVLPAGSWLRALHHYGSQWLTLFLVLHLAQMFWRATYRHRPVAWMACIILLVLILSNGATGYSLPWDARAFFGTRVAEGLAGGLPLLGSIARRWLLGGVEISALTLVRFYALHLLVAPALMLLTVAARLFIFREPEATNSAQENHATNNVQPRSMWRREQAARQIVSAGLIFLALALYAAKFYAPLGPGAEAVSPDYLPRPGLQFLWLFQMLKYIPGRAGSVIALGLPGLFFTSLLALPFLHALPGFKLLDQPRRKLGATMFALSLLLVALMTALAYIGDRRDPRIRAQLARQADEERAFRAQPFAPLRLRSGEDEDAASQTVTPAVGSGDAANSSSNSAAGASSSGNPATQAGPIKSNAAPDAYLKNCANCHGTRGQGFSIFPKLTGVSSKPRRTVEDLIAILDDPAAYGLKPPMKSFADKLTPEEKQQISEWVASLKKGK